MAKTKLVINVPLEDFKKVADIMEVGVGEHVKIGDRVNVEVTFKHPSQLFDLGRYIDKASTIQVPQAASKTTTK